MSPHPAHRHGLRSGADKTAISRYERGIKQPNADTRILIAEAFDVPIRDLELYGWPDWLRDGVDAGARPVPASPTGSAVRRTRGPGRTGGPPVPGGESVSRRMSRSGPNRRSAGAMDPEDYVQGRGPPATRA